MLASLAKQRQFKHCNCWKIVVFYLSFAFNFNLTLSFVPTLFMVRQELTSRQILCVLAYSAIELILILIIFVISLYCLDMDQHISGSVPSQWSCAFRQQITLIILLHVHMGNDNHCIEMLFLTSQTDDYFQSNLCQTRKSILKSIQSTQSV